MMHTKKLHWSKLCSSYKILRIHCRVSLSHLPCRTDCRSGIRKRRCGTITQHRKNSCPKLHYPFQLFRMQCKTFLRLLLLYLTQTLATISELLDIYNACHMPCTWCTNRNHFVSSRVGKNVQVSLPAGTHYTSSNVSQRAPFNTKTWNCLVVGT